MRNLLVCSLALAAILGATIGHLAYLLIMDAPNDLGGPIMAIAGLIAVVLGVAVVEGLDNHTTPGEKP